MNECNGISIDKPRVYVPINIMPVSDLYDESNMEDVRGVINDILRKESPMPLDLLYEKVGATYSKINNESLDNGEEIAGRTDLKHIDKNELVKGIVNRILDSSDFKITQALNGEMCVVWPSTKIGNYCQFRTYGPNGRPSKIDYISIIELKNALKYHYFKDVDDDSIISATFHLLGCKEFNEYRNIAGTLLNEVKKEVPNPGTYIPDVMGERLSRIFMTYGFSQFFRLSEFNGGFNKKPIQLTVDYFFIRSERIIEIVKNELEKVKGVKICEPIEKNYKPYCAYEKSLYGSISFTVERGSHPVIIFKNIIDKVNEQYGFDILYTSWKPYIDKESVLKDAKYRTVDGIVA